MRTRTTNPADRCPTCKRTPHLVPLEQVAAEIGYGPEMLADCATWAGVRLSVVETPEGPAMEAERAVELVNGARAYMEAHYAKWDAYRAYLAERKAEARAEREAAIAKERAEAREAARRRGEQWTAEMARRTEQEIAEREAAKAERDGRPMTPEQFFKRAG